MKDLPQRVAYSGAPHAPRRVAYLHDANVFGGMEVLQLNMLQHIDPCRYQAHVVIPGYDEVDRSSPAEALARALTGDNDTHAASYAAEAGLFQRAGVPAVLCGPGSIEQAHQPDEWIERVQIEEGARFMQKLIARLCA